MNQGFPAVIAEALCTGTKVMTIGVGDIIDIVQKAGNMIIFSDNWDFEYFVQQLEIELSSEYTPESSEIARFQQLFSYDQGGKEWARALR